MEHGHSHEFVDAMISRRGDNREDANARGMYYCFLRSSNGERKWVDRMHNVVTTTGKNLELDTYLSGAGYTVSGPYLGIISASGFAATTKEDTLLRHGGWHEAGRQHGPTYEGARKTMAFHPAADGSKTLLQPCQFTFTTDGFVQGCFMILGAGAVSGIDQTGGTLHSAGVFTSGQREVKAGDTLFCNYAYAI